MSDLRSYETSDTCKCKWCLWEREGIVLEGISYDDRPEALRPPDAGKESE